MSPDEIIGHVGSFFSRLYLSALDISSANNALPNANIIKSETIQTVIFLVIFKSSSWILSVVYQWYHNGYDSVHK